jgi:Uma2 family endonuclease
MTISLSQPIQSNLIYPQHHATWQDYVALRDGVDWRKIVFDQGYLWADMGKEGPNHAAFSDLITALFFIWAFLHPETTFQSYGRCLIEREDTRACAPDLVLYKGDQIPRWQPKESRRIDLNRHRIPDLVGEISDTTLSLDLDEQKRLYASLKISEYWVIDVQGQRLFTFGLNAEGQYESIVVSNVLTGLSIELVAQTLERLSEETNTTAANWLMQQLANQT